MNIPGFDRLPILGILRGITEKDVEPLIDTVICSGLKTIELAMNTPNAGPILKKIAYIAKGKLVIGAGTVLNMGILEEARKNGAEFIVMPTLCKDVVKKCVSKKIPVFPGAFTPQEIYDAWNSGAYMVKVFPAKFLGPAYIKEIRGPFSEIKILACGGVCENNISDFFCAGAEAVAFGESIFRKDWIEERKFKKIEGAIKGLIKNYNQKQR